MNRIGVYRKKTDIGGFVRAPEKTDFARAAILLIAQRAPIFGGFPFGCAFFAAACDAGAAYLYIPVLAAGAFLSGGNMVQYLAAAFMLWIYKALSAKEVNRYKTAAVCAGALIICGICKQVITGGTLIGALSLVAEAIAGFAGCVIFFNSDRLLKKKNKNEVPPKAESFSLIAAIGVVMLGLSGIPLPFSADLRTILGIYLVLCITMYSDYSVSVLFALVCGILGCVETPAALTAGTVFAVSAFFAAVFKHFGQVGASIGFLTGITVCMLFMGDSSYMPVSLIDIFFATAVFAFVPLRFHQKTGIFLANSLKPDNRRRDFRIKEYITEELDSVSNTFSEFSRQFTGSFQRAYELDSDNPSKIFDETAERICSECSRRNDCWHKNFNDTYKYMFEIYNTIGNKGRCDIHEAPLIFTQRCIQPELFLNEFNHVYEITKQDGLNKGARNGERRLFSNQYVEISKIISRLSKEIEGNFFFDEQKEKQIVNCCTREDLYLRDLNVIKDSEGYYEVFFAPGSENDSEKICTIASEVLGVKLRDAFCKNNEIRKLVTDSSFELEISVFQKEKDDEPVSGDTVIHFETDKSKYYIILCDGMGSGCDASRESRMTAELLGGFLKAGFTKNAALNLINSTLALKMDREGFSTIDLCEIDLRSGKCEFVKIGGAQSFVRTNGETVTISAKGLPAGVVEEIHPENAELMLADGDLIIMVSDGVSEAGYGMLRGEWIKRFMTMEGLSVEETAKSIVASARKKIYPRTADDMTAVAAKLHVICENREADDEAVNE